MPPFPATVQLHPECHVWVAIKRVCWQERLALTRHQPYQHNLVCFDFLARCTRLPANSVIALGNAMKIAVVGSGVSGLGATWVMMGVLNTMDDLC